jgi:acetyl esterase/lipase
VIPDKQIYVPPTISAEAQESLRALIKVKPYATEFPAPDDLAGWEKVYDIAEARNKDEADRSLAASHATVTEVQLGGVAGGALTASTVLNLRDQGKGMPAAAVFWSPNTDLSSRDDSTVTLDPDDPILTYSTLLVTGSKAYAGDVALDDPRVSPLYADLSKGFPPALIVVGTKEMLLSSSVRFYQALEAAGQSVKLDVYEGMWHAFPQYGLPESKVAVEKSAEFIYDHLHR